MLIINSISRPNKEHARAVLTHTANTDLSTPRVNINNAETTEFDVYSHIYFVLSFPQTFIIVCDIAR